MPEAGSNFMDWQRVDKESRLFADEDFNWSEPPQRRRITGGAATVRRAAQEPVRAGRRAAVLEYEPELIAPYAGDEHGNQPTAVHSHFDEMMEEWNANYGSGVSRGAEARAERAFDLSDPGVQISAYGARRTVVITGHGDDRYHLPASRHRASELRFHERSGFSPDRAGLWAVLLGIALVIGAIAH